MDLPKENAKESSAENAREIAGKIVGLSAEENVKKK